MRLTDIIKESGRKGEEGSLTFSEIKKVSPREEEMERKKARELYERAVFELQRIGEAVIKGRPFSIERLRTIAKEFVDSLLSKDYLFLEALYREEKDWDLATHSVNTAIIAFKIGYGLRYDRKALNALVLTAFLHDLGMLTIPEEVRKKPGRLTEKEYEIIKSHPLESYRILKELCRDCGVIADIVLQEHEKEDGSGYPKGLKDGEIHEYAKVIGLADIYGALIHPRPQRKRFLPFEAVKQIIAVFKSGFPTKILKAMINELSAFPLGIYVRLNTGEIGRVVSTNRLAPLRPVVEILVNPEGKRLKEPKHIDLSQHHLVHIVEAFYKEEI